MPSNSEQPTIRAHHDGEPSHSSEVASGPTDVTLGGHSRRDTPGASLDAVHNQVQTVALESAVDVLEAERAELQAQVRALESKVDTLESERDRLKRRVRQEEQRRRQVVDKYEYIIAEKDEAYQDLRQDRSAEPTATDGGHRSPISALLTQMASRLRRLSARLRE